MLPQPINITSNQYITPRFSRVVCVRDTCVEALWKQGIEFQHCVDGATTLVCPNRCPLVEASATAVQLFENSNSFKPQHLGGV